MARTDDLILAIDQGTGSTKAMLVDAQGRVVATAASALGQHHPQPGWVEQDPVAIWRSVQAVVRDCVPPADAKRVAAVGLSVQRESVLLWERSTGRPLSPLLSWQDERTRERAEALAERAAEVRAVTGLPLDPMFSALKGSWLLDRLDPDRARTSSGEWVLGTIDAWLLSQMSPGDPVMEIGSASRTQLLAIETGQWSPAMLELFEIPPAAMPRVTPSGGPFPSVRGLGPLPDGVPVLAVLGDSHAALFAQAGWRAGTVKATYGTGSSIMATGGSVPPESGVCATIAWHVDRITHAAEANIRSTGRTLSWLADVLGVGVSQLLEEAEAARSHGVVLVPAFGGLGAPRWDMHATPILSGFSLGSGRAELARAALESVAHQVVDVLEAFEAAGIAVKELVCDGGMTRSEALLQLQADLAGRPVLASTTENLSALGVAHLAGIGLDFWSMGDLEARTDEQRAASRAFVPREGEASRKRDRDAWNHAVRRSRLRV